MPEGIKFVSFFKSFRVKRRIKDLKNDLAGI